MPTLMSKSMINYFPNHQGDYTITLNEEPIAVALNEQSAQNLCAAFRVLELKQSDGVLLISKERQRQIDQEGWTEKHDDKFYHRELVRAAVCYLEADNLDETRNEDGEDLIECGYWPWDKSFWKPTITDRVRELVKAGALIAAEIDRIKRLDDQD